MVRILIVAFDAKVIFVMCHRVVMNGAAVMRVTCVGVVVVRWEVI